MSSGELWERKERCDCGDGNVVEIQGRLEGRHEGGDFLTSLEMCKDYQQLRGFQIESLSSP